MTYIITINEQRHKVEARDQVIISDCRWYGYSVVDLLITCMVFGYGFEMRRNRDGARKI